MSNALEVKLHKDLQRLSDEVALLNSHRFVRIHNSLLRMVGFQLLRGLAFGLGSALGATALVSVAVLLLSHIEFVPIIGELASQVINEIKVEN
ncbi:DUF5665 domain-containing protein [Pelagimonas varians]|uniref:Uncharacterized protein n=1 Tax=Pelagimonas varians TaxID=696760 RepID=A0A238K380_9RHOB|nr:DUF5665 domain-containing protein [Pelagimonas varians]PYG30539.1 hypothetical protein C8N36_106248 [Pelagimonas varians]SMX37350.1 hypothetical protein PEV8663_01042 [Pelagimonas varians]